MKNRIESVREYYNKGTEHEWNRFERHRFEFPITLKHINKCIGNSPLKILDVGGGPGRYSIQLAKLGHEVFLLDLSDENIKYAKIMAEQNNVKIVDYIVGDACDLTQFSDKQFDVVLNFGPLYHLVNEIDRNKAILESLRVLKDNGQIAFAYISKYAPIYDTIRRYQNDIKKRRIFIDNMYKSGINIMNEKDHNFTNAYFIEPFEIETIMTTFGLKKLSLFGAEGPIAQSENHLIGLGDVLLNEWIEFAFEMSETNAGIIGSDHVVYIGKKDI